MGWIEKRKEITQQLEFDRQRARAVAMIDAYQKRAMDERSKTDALKSAHHMRDFEYWETNFLNKGRRLPTHVTLYGEEEKGWRKASIEQDRRDFMEKFWPWFWGSFAFVAVFTFFMAIGFPEIAISMVIFTCIAAFAIGMADAW